MNHSNLTKCVFYPTIQISQSLGPVSCIHTFPISFSNTSQSNLRSFILNIKAPAICVMEFTHRSFMRRYPSFPPGLPYFKVSSSSLSNFLPQIVRSMTWTFSLLYMEPVMATMCWRLKKKESQKSSHLTVTG